MKYTKPPLSYEEQADQLLHRGLVAEREQLIATLKSVNYYRLSGYWYLYRNPNHTFKPGTKLSQIWNLYTFDRQLRLLVLDAIERVEIHVRSQLAYHLAQNTGPFGYLEEKNLPNINSDEHRELLSTLRQEYHKSKESFVTHFKEKYGNEHDLLPIWMVTEIMTLGSVLTLFRGVRTDIKKSMGKSFNIDEGVLKSWLRSLNASRNICAHHGRLWNRELGYKPKIPKKDPRWHRPVAVFNNRIFVILTILKYLLNYIAPQSKWSLRLENLLQSYPDIPRGPMGFSDNWQECPIWQGVPKE